MYTLLGLVWLSTLTQLSLQGCLFSDYAMDVIAPGSWPCLLDLSLDNYLLHSRPYEASIQYLLHLTGLERLSLMNVSMHMDWHWV